MMQENDFSSVLETLGTSVDLHSLAVCLSLVFPQVSPLQMEQRPGVHYGTMATS